MHDQPEKGIIETEYCSTEEMMADILTKPLSRDVLEKFSPVVTYVIYEIFLS